MVDEDTKLMIQVKEGDRSAFDVLAKKYSLQIMNLIYKYTSDYSLSEELAQEVFLRAYRARRTYRPEASFYTWLYRIAVNLSLNSLRSQKNSPEIDMEGGLDSQERPQSNRPLDQIEGQERREKVLEALGKVAEKERMALILNVYQDLSYKEVGEVMNISLSMVKWLIFQGKKSLHQKLKPYMESQTRSEFHKGK